MIDLGPDPTADFTPIEREFLAYVWIQASPYYPLLARYHSSPISQNSQFRKRMRGFGPVGGLRG